MLELRFIAQVLAKIRPEEFVFEDEEIRFNDLIYLFRQFFLNRNFDGKTLFRVLGKQYSAKDHLLQTSDEVAWKLLELTLLVAFFCRGGVDELLSDAVNDLQITRWSEADIGSNFMYGEAVVLG